MKRRSLSPMKRLAIFEAKRGTCHICGQRIHVGERWEVEHPIPIALGGADDESNMVPDSGEREKALEEFWLAYQELERAKTCGTEKAIARAHRRLSAAQSALASPAPAEEK